MGHFWICIIKNTTYKLDKMILMNEILAAYWSYSQPMLCGLELLNNVPSCSEVQAEIIDVYAASKIAAKGYCKIELS